MTVTITAATPHVVTWRVGNSLTIESTRDAVDAWVAQAELTGSANVDGLTLTLGDLHNLRAAMDDMWAAIQDKRLDRAEQWDSNWT